MNAVIETQKVKVVTEAQFSRELYSPHPWQGKTAYEFTLHGKVARLTIHTSKTGAKIRSTANLGWITKGGLGVTTRLGIGGGGDFYALAAPDAVTRCTEKAIREQHGKALANYHTTMAAVLAHYDNPASVLQDAKSAE